MNTSSMKWSTVDVYISAQDQKAQERLIVLRHLVIRLCPVAGESICYGMPAYTLNKKPLIYFAAFTHHIGVYATPSAHSEFAKELVGYKQGKGSVQFPYDQPLPLDLIEKMIKFKVKDILQQ